MTVTITMPDMAPDMTLLRLFAWASPAFPTGAFAYSNGLERAIYDRQVADHGSLQAWLKDLLTIGSAWNDAILFTESWRHNGDRDGLQETAALAEALAGSAERRLETMRQGSAFLEAARAWPNPVCDRLPADCPLPVAAGAVAGAHGAALRPALAVYLQAFVSNQIQAALRLMPLGQQGGVEILAAMEPVVGEVAHRAAESTLDDLGGAAIGAEIAAMKHETQSSRLFRS